jgi:hypothetical protein
VRRVVKKHEFHEEVILRIGDAGHVNDKVIEQQINEALGRLLKKKANEKD